MSKITRYQGNFPAFGEDFQSQERTAFGTEDVGQNDLTQNMNQSWLRGWGIISPSEFPPIQYFNALGFTLSRVLEYLHQMGVAEWHVGQEYHTGSFTQKGGSFWASKTDNNVGNDPEADDGTNWVKVPNAEEVEGQINSLGVAQSVDSVATLRASSFPANLERLWLDGYSGTGTEGGGNLYESTGTGDGGLKFEDADGRVWARNVEGVPQADWFGLRGSVSKTDWQNAFDTLSAAGYSEIAAPFDVNSLDGVVDCKGLRLICSDTVIPSDANSFENHGGIVRGIIAGVNTSFSQINVTEQPSFEKSKFIRWDSGRNFTVYSAKKNPDEGFLEILSEENITTTTNSIGGDAATRITSVRNVNDLIGYKHSFDTANHTPDDSVTRAVGSGTGGQALAFWDIPSGGGTIRFDTGHVIEEVSILFLISGGSSDNVTVRWDGVDQETISLLQPSGGPDFFIYRLPVTPGSSQITLVNNGTETAYVAGINAYRPGEEIKRDVDVDSFGYTYNTNDYTNSKGAVDYAFRRHPDSYGGSDPTGGSYHGGETINSESVRLDGEDGWTNMAGASVGSIAAAKKIVFVSNVDITWPGDGESIQVTRINTIGDGSIFKEVRADAGTMVFDAVWLTMWTTPSNATSVRGLTAREISGVSSEFQCYDRGNEIRQDDAVNFGVRNSWTLFDDERNSNGGVYIASENAGSREKLYYGPVLFNKGAVGTVHTQQYTEFHGKD